MQMLLDGGFRAYFVGGCVRNALLGQPASDLDIATDARPEKVMELAQAQGLRAIGTGLQHGTATVVAGSKNFEITTFRRDVDTDGRHATVEFSSDIMDDARRRDFTMNALYADIDGEIVDPLSGLSDVLARQVRFVDDADARIKEDYLRILRYFRFHAWYGAPEAGADADALSAIAENAEGLATVSRERIGTEVKKLLAAPNPAPAVGLMVQTGVLARILPGSDARYLAPLVHLENGLDPDAIRRLAVLGGEDVARSLRFSNAERTKLSVLRHGIEDPAGVAELAYRYGAKEARNIALVRAALFETPLPQTLDKDLNLGANAVFPISSADLMPDLEGPALGRRLKQLERAWIDAGFSLSKEALLRQ